MKQVKYKGRANTRVIQAKDWQKAGVEDQLQVVWNLDNDFVAEVSDDAAEYLKQAYGSTFEIVSDDARDNDDEDTS